MDRVLASQNSYHLIPAKRYENTAGTGPGPLTLQERALTVAPWFIGHERLPRLGGGQSQRLRPLGGTTDFSWYPSIFNQILVPFVYNIRQNLGHSGRSGR